MRNASTSGKGQPRMKLPFEIRISDSNFKFQMFNFQFQFPIPISNQSINPTSERTLIVPIVHRHIDRPTHRRQTRRLVPSPVIGTASPRPLVGRLPHQKRMIHEGIQGKGLAVDEARGGHGDEFVGLGVDPVQFGRFAGFVLDLDGAGLWLR